jgi:hypothetical protein
VDVPRIIVALEHTHGETLCHSDRVLEHHPMRRTEFPRGGVDWLDENRSRACAVCLDQAAGRKNNSLHVATFPRVDAPYSGCSLIVGLKRLALPDWAAVNET